MNISNELLAAYAQGNVTPQERDTVRQYLMSHPDDLETVMMAMDEDYELQLDSESKTSSANDFHHSLSSLLEGVSKAQDSPDKVKVLPIYAMAAQNAIDNLCVIKCEAYTLRHFGYDISEQELLKISTKQGWQRPEGTSLYNIGRLCGMLGLNVATHYNCTLSSIKAAIGRGDVVIAVVNSETLSRHSANEAGSATPNHAVIVTAVDTDFVTIQDPDTTSFADSFHVSRFITAWQCSCYNLVVIGDNDDNYEPHPLDLSGVDLAEDLTDLREAIAENAHEVWAYNRKKEGWTYGPVRDDEKKTTPDLVPYNRLPESEKLYDREMAMSTIKLLHKLGWEVRRKE